MEAQTHPLYTITQAHNVVSTMWLGVIKPAMVEGRRLVVSIRPATRSTEQNAKLHALLGDIADRVKWAGAKRDIEVWKRLLTAAWLRARGESIEVLPAVDGHGIDVVFRHTSKLTVTEMSELIEFVTAWAIENGVEVGG